MLVRAGPGKHVKQGQWGVGQRDEHHGQHIALGQLAVGAFPDHPQILFKVTAAW